MTFTTTTAAVLVFVAVAAFVVWVGIGVVKARLTATDRLAVYGRESLRSEQLKKSIAERAIAPLLLGAGRFVAKFTPIGYLNWVQRKLVHGGLTSRLDANSFAVIHLLSFITAVVGYFFLITNLSLTGRNTFLAAVMFLILGAFGPIAVIQRRADERKTAMQRALPDVLDLLVISVEAGLGFDSALARVVETVPGPLAEEFFRMLQETRVGVSRRDAMRHLMDRTDLDELRSFLLAMMQAEAFGVTISRVLRVQADEMRVKRRQRAQERAFAAPVKMVFPLVFCIFPSLFIVLLGPAFISIYENFINR
ncbi:MAG: type II secretion system F family protein [Acidimicrobiia bacterium]|nr:type II secretion system F family protein [Acidimicrobiia bacterium]MDH5503635.1 type II secretion system F family protein [Acidimicrobiia bacterium]